MAVSGSINWLEQIFFSISAMAIVFGVLVLLMLLINVMSVIFKERKKNAVEEPKQVIEEEVVEEQEETDDCEVVAAIMAALSASLNVPTDKLMIKKIKRIDRSSNWKN